MLVALMYINKIDRLRGIIVSLLRRSVNPTVAMSTPSTNILPSVASTKRKNDRARVLLPDPVRPRIPILIIDELLDYRGKGGRSGTFSPAFTSKLTL